jgi:hypothetical protein
MADTLTEYKEKGKRFGINESTITNWWNSLSEHEQEGMTRLALVGYAGAGLAAVLDPSLLPLVTLPAGLYFNKERIHSALEKLHILHKERDKLKEVGI